jgi:hypothetical protein
MIEPGTYTAKIVDYEIEFSSQGNPQVVLLFQVEGTTDRIRWYGHLTEKAKNRTYDTLELCGFRGTSLDDFCGGVASRIIHPIDMKTPFSIVVENEQYQGKTYTKVKWINRIGGSAHLGKADFNKIKAKLAELNVKADLMQRKQKAPAEKALDLDNESDVGF